MKCFNQLQFNHVTFILALYTFSHNVRLCITTNACILVQYHVSGLDMGDFQEILVLNISSMKIKKMLKLTFFYFLY